MKKSALNKRLSEAGNPAELLGRGLCFQELIRAKGNVLPKQKKSTGSSRVKRLGLLTVSEAKDAIEAGKMLLKELKKNKIGAKFFCFHVPKKGEESFVVQ